jgi:NAD(P)-dependent dehydrogenase (short-subunit alcohol dehydrogenase family)
VDVPASGVRRPRHPRYGKEEKRSQNFSNKNLNPNLLTMPAATKRRSRSKAAPAAKESQEKPQRSRSKNARASKSKKTKDSDDEHEGEEQDTENNNEEEVVVKKGTKQPKDVKKAEEKTKSSFLGRLFKRSLIFVVLLGIAAYYFDALPVNASLQTLDREALVSMVSASSLSGADAANPLVGVTAVVTGATSGLGRSTATELYGMGATVILASRNAEKCKNVQVAISAEYPQSKGKMDCDLTLDLSDLSTVTTFARLFDSRYKHLHLLINNAGMHYVSSPELNTLTQVEVPQVSRQGYDLSWSSNYQGHFLLTKLLLPGMIEAEKISGKQGRIINVASSYHFGSDGTMLKPNGDIMPEAARSDVNTFTHRNRAYSNSKFAQVLHAKELQKRLNAIGQNSIKVQSVCPAWVATGILPNNLGGHFVGRHAFTPKAAALIPIGAAVKPECKGGEFVAIFQNWFSNQSWSHDLFRKITSWGIRDAACNALSMFILASQGKTYGVHIQPSSPEYDDDDLSSALYDWSEKVSTEFVEAETKEREAAAAKAAEAKFAAEKKREAADMEMRKAEAKEREAAAAKAAEAKFAAEKKREADMEMRKAEAKKKETDAKMAEMQKKIKSQEAIRSVAELQKKREEVDRLHNIEEKAKEQGRKRAEAQRIESEGMKRREHEKAKKAAEAQARAQAQDAGAQ